MDLFQHSYNTYDNVRNKNMFLDNNSLMELCPKYHQRIKAHIEIWLDRQGNFVSAKNVVKKDALTIIPVTVESCNRTTGIAPRPLCEQICYLAPIDRAKYNAYLAQLDEWLVKSPSLFLKAVFTYVAKGTIIRDLSRSNILKMSNNDKKVSDKGTFNGTRLVRWIVDGLQSWRNPQIISSWQKHYKSICNSERGFCMVTGEETALSPSHDRNIFKIYSTAKLISSNDKTDFSFRGRFTTSAQSSTVGYDASQKIHKALQWIGNNHSVTVGGRIFACWCPEGGDVFHWLISPIAQDEAITINNSIAYMELIHSKLRTYQHKAGERVVCGSFDAATPGRICITDFIDIEKQIYFQSMYEWYTTFYWWKDSNKIHTPTFIEIAESCFGVEDELVLYVKDALLKNTVQRLSHCVFQNMDIPTDIVNALVLNASSPERYRNQKNRKKILYTACAVIRKYRNDEANYEKWTLSLAPDVKDLSYQFGRLLAILEKMEIAARRGHKKNYCQYYAVKLRHRFKLSPMNTYKRIEKLITPSLIALDNSKLQNFLFEIESVLQRIYTFPIALWDQPLSDTYLLGYYLQSMN